MPVTLTEGAITKAARDVVSAGERRDLSDAGCPGLRLRLTPGGAATWVLACRDREGRMRRFVLGRYEGKKGMGLADARNAARKLHVEIKNGAPDPIAEKRKALAIGRDAKDGIGTLAGLLDLYQGKGKPGATLRSWKQQRQSIEHVFAKHLNRPLATMAVTDLRVTASEHEAAYSAALAVRCLRPIVKWAADHGYAPAGLADIKPPATVGRRKRVLSRDELVALLPALRASRRPYGAALLLMLLTLTRRQETAMARWRHINLAARTWTIPETKNGEPHTVPLSQQALDLLRSRLPTGDDGKPMAPDPDALIFTTSTGAPLGNWDRETKAIQETSGTEGWTRHDLRRTGATMLGDMGEMPDIIEAALNHVAIHSALAATYNRSRYRPQVASAVQRLADELDEIEDTAKKK
jgi:integrase